MVSPARKLAYRMLRQIEAGTIFSDDALNSASMERLEVRDRHLVTEIVYGTLRWQGTLDWVLAGISSRDWQAVEAPVRVLLRMSLYQMWQMDRIPDHALVNDAVELAKQDLGKGIDKYLNGILRRLTRTRPWKEEDFLQSAPPWIRCALPQWLWGRWSERFGDTQAMAFALSLNRPPTAAFRLAGDELESLPFAAVRSDLVPGAAIGKGVPSERNGRYPSQDEASQMIPYLLTVESGWRIWDACAAPGGKTAILCGLCGRSGQVVASDVSAKRIVQLRSLAGTATGAKADLLVADARQPPPFRRAFDAVLADVPCSGLGTLRRNPEIKWQFRQDRFASIQRTQKDILESASDSVRAGGRLLYSTCSTEPEENEQVVEWFLRSHHDFCLNSPSAPDGIAPWIGTDGMVRTFPSDRLWDGFFAALMIRRS